MLSESNRVSVIDKRFSADVADGKFTNHLFLRLVAKKKRFATVDFKYSIFDTCYLRDCFFESCDFTGCRFVGSNLHGSKFSGCKFDYSSFERTLVESDILDTECPGLDNLKSRFARTLRMNYQQLGDAEAANKAIRVELEASKSHKRKAWAANEAYYRRKYSGIKRIKAFMSWVLFTALHWIWGNGESAAKLLRTSLAIFVVMAVVDVFLFRDTGRVSNYVLALGEAPQIFLGTDSPSYYPHWYLAVIVFMRLTMFGFFMSIMIKRLNRR
jgi:hypothetical protein